MKEPHHRHVFFIRTRQTMVWRQHQLLAGLLHHSAGSLSDVNQIKPSGPARSGGAHQLSMTPSISGTCMTLICQVLSSVILFYPNTLQLSSDMLGCSDYLGCTRTRTRSLVWQAESLIRANAKMSMSQAIRCAHGL
eukprot:scaffold39318_cov20-Prasinocladus_malaysianus.AAC.1